VFVEIFLVLGVSKINLMKHEWRVYEFQAALNKNIALSLLYRSICGVQGTYCKWKKEKFHSWVCTTHTSCVLLVVGKCDGDPSESV